MSDFCKKLENDYAFNYWFAGLAVYCINSPNALWDNYLWDLYAENKEWKLYFREGLTPEDAVNKFFISEVIQ
jgi:hypothetical protein